MLIATPTIFSNSSVNTAYAKTTHEFCFVALLYSGNFLVGSTSGCSKTLSDCQVGQTTIASEGSGDYSAKITKECFKSINSDKSTNNYCWDLRPAGDGKECFSSKKEWESNREKSAHGKNYYRVGEVCYKL
jgi:hypothetical protein